MSLTTDFTANLTGKKNVMIDPATGEIGIATPSTGGISNVVTYFSILNFPLAGVEGNIYIDTNGDKAYLWDNTAGAYKQIGKQKEILQYSNSINNYPVFDEIKIDSANQSITQPLPTHCKITLPAYSTPRKCKVWVDYDMLESCNGVNQNGVTRVGSTQNYYATLSRSFNTRPQFYLNGNLVFDYAQPKEFPASQNTAFGVFDIPAGATPNVITTGLVLGYFTGYTVGVDDFAGIFDSAIMAEVTEI